MHIGELARRTGIQVETIRYYEREGLLPEPARSDGNYRVYGPGHLPIPLCIVLEPLQHRPGSCALSPVSPRRADCAPLRRQTAIGPSLHVLLVVRPLHTG